ncbi:hypothetical protein FRC10_000840 [Ceratobasidium sp. 414]|nr:hypothetical protein FRC10_000840 [Ceratobasidium sp. 414]
MLLNRLFSLTVLLSVAGSVMTAPLPRPLEVKPLDGAEVEIEQEEDQLEIEVEIKKPALVEIEVEVVDPTSNARRARLTARSHPTRSLASSVLAAQKQLDVLTPQIEQAMQGPLGSIEKSVGEPLTSVHDAALSLEVDIQSFVGDADKVLYLNPEGTGPLTDAELAKIFSKFFLGVADIEEKVKHVSGFTVTSAQLNIRNDLLSMKTTLSSLLPVVFSNVANILSMALSMGTGAAGITA